MEMRGHYESAKCYVRVYETHIMLAVRQKWPESNEMRKYDPTLTPFHAEWKIYKHNL